MTKPVIVVHGGAGEWPKRKHKLALDGVRQAASLGFEVLQRGGIAMEAIEAAIISMEDNPIFNAGTGSALNLAGDIETDASVMEGRSLQSGAVALITGVKNPIRLAKIIMEKTDHVLVAGGVAEQFADKYKIPRGNLKVIDRIWAWRQGRLDLKRGKLRHLSRNSKLLQNGFLPKAFDTVGALALDERGDFAAGASTGGLSLKLPGRIGDSAIIGAGIYADNRLGAAAASGIGEIAVRLTVSKTACDLMKRSSAEIAVARVIRLANRRVGRGLGIITMDREGRHGIAHSTQHLCWAMRAREGGPLAGMSGRHV